MDLHGLNGEEGENYIRLMDTDRALHIETDDVDAEAGRLEALGAKRVKKVRTWWVMEAPTGQRFCVVRAKGSGFAGRANRWK